MSKIVFPEPGSQLTLASVTAPENPGLPLDVARLLTDALNQALLGSFPMMSWQDALDCLREARMAGVEARIDFERAPRKLLDYYVLIVDGIKVRINPFHPPLHSA